VRPAVPSLQLALAFPTSPPHTPPFPQSLLLSQSNPALYLIGELHTTPSHTHTHPGSHCCTSQCSSRGVRLRVPQQTTMVRACKYWMQLYNRAVVNLEVSRSPLIVAGRWRARGQQHRVAGLASTPGLLRAYTRYMRELPARSGHVTLSGANKSLCVSCISHQSLELATRGLLARKFTTLCVV